MTTFLINGKPNRLNTTRWIDPILRKVRKSSFTVTPSVPGTAVHFVLENRRAGLRVRLNKMKTRVHLVLEELEVLTDSNPSLMPVWLIRRDDVIDITDDLAQILQDHLLRVTPYYTDTQIRRSLKAYPDGQGGIYGGKIIAAVRQEAGTAIHLESGYVHLVNTPNLPQPAQWLLARTPDQFALVSEWDVRTHYKEA